jgi:hypothetical protein
LSAVALLRKVKPVSIRSNSIPVKEDQEKTGDQQEGARPMAKKKAATKPLPVIEGEPQQQKAGPGHKICPGCKEEIASRSSKCPKCGHDFPKKEKKTGAKTGSRRGRKATQAATPVDPSSRLAEIQAAVQLVEKLGGVEEAKKKLQTVKEVLG